MRTECNAVGVGRLFPSRLLTNGVPFRANGTGTGNVVKRSPLTGFVHEGIPRSGSVVRQRCVYRLGEPFLLLFTPMISTEGFTRSTMTGREVRTLERLPALSRAVS